MEDKHRRRLDLLSGIDDKILDRQTAQRIHLLAGSKKRRFTKQLWISVGSAAAALLLVLSSLLVIVPLLSKQVPIYTGMTVSGENTAHTLATAIHTVHYADPGNTNNNGNHYGWYDGDSTDQEDVSEDMIETPLENALSVTGGAKSLYTAKPGEDIYITVHLENPDSFEILSFTLGGQKYSSYMFEQGSDMENIVIKVNVGDAQGIVDYTIDAIKYVDGNKIKDVRMDGERTVQVGVAAKTQPTATVAEQRISFDSIRLGLTNEDALGLISLTGGKLIALLYDGSSVVQEKEISTQTAVSVTFDGLSPNCVYQYAIVAHYDAFDGNGMADHVLLKDTFRTASPVLFDRVTVGISTLDFSYLWDAGASDRAVSATLYTNGSKVRDVGNATSIEGLLPATTYTLIAEYSLNGKTEQITLEFTTEQLIYTVRYLLSPLTGTEYMLESEESKVLMPGDTFAPAVKTIEGFTSPAAKTLVANTEDGTRVIEYRYTRNTYNVSFNVNGSVTMQSLPYGTPLTPATHVSHTFAHWQDAANNKHTTVPAKNITLYAVFAGELTADDLLFSGTGEITITGLRNTAFTELVIPAYVNGGKVVAIGEHAFKNATYLTSVTLPATLRRVGADAFGGCTDLTRVTFDGTLAEWCHIEFAENPSAMTVAASARTVSPATRYTANPVVYARSLYLTSDPDVNVLAGTLTLPLGTLSGKNSFVNAPTTTLVIPEGATAMPSAVLVGLYDLEALHFNATHMPDMAGADPYRLLDAGANGDGVAVSIGAGVTRIPANGPFGVAKIKSVLFAEGSTCTEIGAGAFKGCATLSAVVLPITEVTIGEGAFEGCTALATLSLPVGRFELPALFGETSPAVTSVTLLGSGALPASAFEGWTGLVSVTLPEGITAIGENAFKGCTALTSVSLPASLTGIGSYAFQNCTALSTVEIPVGIARIESYTFYGCTSLAAVTFAEGCALADIGDDAFENCAALASLEIPAGVTRIGHFAFRNCTSLASVYISDIAAWCSITFHGSYSNPLRYAKNLYLDGALVTELEIPATVTSIKNYAFYGYTALTAVKIPTSVTKMNSDVFGECSNLATVTFAEDSRLENIGYSSFYHCTALTAIEIPSSVMRMDPFAFSGCTSLATVTFTAGSGLTSIGTSAFYGCASLAAIEIPASVTSIGKSAFYGCTDLTTVIFAENSRLTSIDSTVFYSCAALTAIEIPAGVASIGSSAFNGCTSLATVTFAENSTLTEIGNNIFQGCSALTSIDLPTSVTSIGRSAFIDCSALPAIKIPAGVTSIEDHTFRNCASLTAIEIPATVTSIGSNVFSGCTALTTATVPVPIPISIFPNVTDLIIIPSATSTVIPADYCKGNTKLTSVVIEEGVTDIGNNAFYNCTALASISLPDTLKALGHTSFMNCSSLTAIVIPEGVTQILGHTFRGCTMLSDVTLPSALSDLNGNSFNGCTSLAQIDIPKTLTFLGGNAFEGCTGLKKISLPANARISANVFKGCTALKTLTLPNMSSSLQTLFGATPTHVTSVTVLGGTSVADNAFLNCTGLVSVSLPNTVTSIGSSAFRGCTALVIEALPSGLTSIGGSAFHSCAGLTVDTLPDGLTTIGGTAFYGCTGLTVDSLPDGLTSIGGSAFYGCTRLTVDSLPVGLVTIGAYAFRNCTGITNLSIPTSVTSIGYGALDGCPLVSISLPGCTGANDLFASTVPETLARVTVVGTAIPAHAFDGNRWLDRMELIIAEGVTSIGDHAFYQRSMNSITFPSTLESIGEHAFYNCGAKTMTFLGGGIAMGESAFSSCYRLKSVHINDVFAWTTNSYAGAYSSPLYSAEPYLNGEPITEITIPADVTRFGPDAFYGFTSLASVHITDMTAWLDLEFEGLYANPMYYADHLYLNGQEITELTIPNGMTVIGDYAFLNLTSLQSVMVPEGVTHIGTNAFRGCTGLKNISLPNTLEYVGYGAFDQTVNTYTDPETGAMYLGNEQNKYLVLMYVGSCDYEGEFFVVPEQTKIVYSVDRDASVVLHDNIVCITNIENTLHGCSPFRSLPSSLKYLLCRELWCDQNLETFEIPDSVIQIGDGLISGTSIETLKIGKGIEVLDERFFYNVSIENLYLSNNLKEIKFTFSTEDPSDCSFTADEIYFDGTREEWLAIEGHDHFSIRSVTFLQA